MQRRNSNLFVLFNSNNLKDADVYAGISEYEARKDVQSMFVSSITSSSLPGSKTPLALSTSNGSKTEESERELTDFANKPW